MPIVHYFSLEHQFGPGEGDTPEPEVDYDFEIIVGANDDDALGYHKAEDGSSEYGTLIKGDYDGLILSQFRYLTDGANDLRVRFIGGETPFNYLTLLINDETTVKMHADLELSSYVIKDNKVAKYFVEGDTVKAKVVKTTNLRKKK